MLGLCDRICRPKEKTTNVPNLKPSDEGIIVGVHTICRRNQDHKDIFSAFPQSNFWHRGYFHKLIIMNNGIYLSHVKSEMTLE